MSIKEGREYFRNRGIEDRVQEFTVSSATVDLAAAALGVEGARIAKTLSFKTADGCMLILAAGDARIDNHKFKEKFHFKAKMLSSDEVLEMVGHPVGGVCPFGIKPGIPVYLDVSLKRFVTVFPAVDQLIYSTKSGFYQDRISGKHTLYLLMHFFGNGSFGHFCAKRRKSQGFDQFLPILVSRGRYKLCA